MGKRQESQTCRSRTTGHAHRVRRLKLASSYHSRTSSTVKTTLHLFPPGRERSMPSEPKAPEPEGPSLDLARTDKLKALELVYSFALTYSSSFNTVGAAVIFGLFSLLLLISASAFLSAGWLILSAAYFLTVLTGVYFYLRAVRYNMMANEAAKRLGIISLAEDVYRQTPGANS